MVRTEKIYCVDLPYKAKKGQTYTDTKIRVIGVNDVMLIFSECNGQTYENLKRVKQLKTASPDAVLEKAVNKEAGAIAKWLGKAATGADLYKHGIKTCMTKSGMSLTNFFEMVAEDCIVWNDDPIVRMSEDDIESALNVLKEA